MYRQEPGGGLYFVPNALDRFSIGDRSPQIRAEEDGSFDIFVQTAKPTGERVVNWLPAPKGRFVLVFRGLSAEGCDAGWQFPDASGG